MKEYKTLNLIALTHGTIGLSDDQYKRRKHTKALEKAGDGTYKIVGAVNLKAGESFTYKEQLGKALLAKVEEVKPKPKAKGGSK